MRDFIQELKDLSHLFPFDPSTVEQTTDDWHILRMGCFTASNAKHLLSTKRGTKTTNYGTDYTIAPPSTQGRKTYMSDLVAKIGAPCIPEDILAKPLEWGRENEPLARDAYEALTFNTVSELPFVYKDKTMRYGSSPDGIGMPAKGKPRGLELKSPWSDSVFIQFATQDKLKHEERHQCQFNMWCSDLDVWDCAKFDPRMVNCKKLHMIEVERDPIAMELFDEAMELFSAEMDVMLDKLGMEFGQQWEYFLKQ
jgi:hypothetical protein